MIKVIYIHNQPAFDLQYNKIYFAINVGSGDLYCIYEDEEKCECGIEIGFFFKNHFITLAEWRDKQINEIINE
jgi:hypothetical protein